MKPPKEPHEPPSDPPAEPPKKPEPEDAAMKALTDSVEQAISPQIARMEAGTLAGDVRDVILTHFRNIKVPWSMLAEDEQRNVIEAAEKCGRDVARRAVSIVTQSGWPTVSVSLDGLRRGRSRSNSPRP